MPGNKDIHNDPKHNTNGFKQNPQNIGGGRPLKIYTILKRKGFSADDIKAAFGELAFYTLTELKDVHQDEKKPVITRIVANQFYTALKDSDWTKIKEILQYTVGMPKQLIETTGTNELTKLKIELIEPGSDDKTP